ncbi:MAG: histidine phosphatase family protein [Alphaproteobacteria bacterium]|nr:histidine phosphatase family protein [Alphaproteobacteria bacterium]
MLHLLRHAKSSAKEDVEDHQRPLSRRGRKAARRVGKNLSAKLGAIDLVLCSSARRTRETLDLLLDELSPGSRTLIEDELYLASREKLATRLARLDARDVNVLLIGHNPGLYELAVALADKTSPAFEALASGKFPTAACVSFRVPADWSVLGSSQHELIGYVTPESLADEDE